MLLYVLNHPALRILLFRVVFLIVVFVFLLLFVLELVGLVQSFNVFMEEFVEIPMEK